MQHERPSPASPSAPTRRGRRLDLRGAVCVVTGAASGMGLESARLLAARGAALALVDRDGDALDGLAAELRAATASTCCSTAPASRCSAGSSS